MAHGNYGPGQRITANRNTVISEYATDWVSTQLETLANGVREPLHCNRGFGVDEASPGCAPGEQYGPTNQLGMGHEPQRVVAASGPGVLGEDVRVDWLTCQVLQKFGDRPCGALQGGHELDSRRLRNPGHCPR